jgi:hypothetical protein
VAEQSGPGPLSRDPFDISYPRALLGLLVIVTGIAVVVAASTSGAAFGVYNPAWDGASDLREEASAVGTESELVLNTSAYADQPANGTVAVVLSPDRRYTDREAARLRQFVANGGTLVVAEDFGPHSNALLAAVGADARINGSLLRDERYNYQSPALPLARNVSNHSYVTDVDELTLNHGTVVEPNGARTIVASSEYAYLDRNRNDELDDNESLGTYPVATVESVGQGQVVTVSDPSLFINAMLDRSGNEQFVQSLFADHERVLLDYSHAERLPPLALALVVVRKTPLLQVLLVGLGVAVVGAVGRGWGSDLVARVRGTDPEATPNRWTDSDELAAYLHTKHPDWDDARVRRVTEGIMNTRGQARDDE